MLGSSDAEGSHLATSGRFDGRDDVRCRPFLLPTLRCGLYLEPCLRDLDTVPRSAWFVKRLITVGFLLFSAACWPNPDPAPKSFAAELMLCVKNSETMGEYQICKRTVEIRYSAMSGWDGGT